MSFTVTKKTESSMNLENVECGNNYSVNYVLSSYKGYNNGSAHSVPRAGLAHETPVSAQTWF